MRWPDLTKKPLRCCDIWDTDYKTDNWEPEFMTIFVTRQLIVTLDSIRNSCDVFFFFQIWWKMHENIKIPVLFLTTRKSTGIENKVIVISARCDITHSMPSSDRNSNFNFTKNTTGKKVFKMWKCQTQIFFTKWRLEKSRSNISGTIAISDLK